MGKGGGVTPPPVGTTNNALEEGAAASSAAMSSMMAGMSQSMAAYGSAMTNMQSMMNSSILASTPEVYSPPDVDWEATKAELDAKAKATYGIDIAKKVNLGNSVYSSPLLDDQQADTTNQSLIAS
jgi:hypothetical protein